MIDETKLATYGPAEVPDPSSVYTFRVVDAETETLAVKFCEVLASEIKGFQAGKAEVVDPVYRAYKRGLDWFQARIKPREAAKQHLRAQIEAYRASKRATVRVALHAATSHAEVREAVEAVVTTPEGLSERDDWRFVVTDPAALPREFLVPDQAKLDAAAKLHKGQTQIPGGMAVCRKVPVIG